jgi:peroxiredoxin Q/BCP
MAKLSPKDPAPAFTLLDQEGKTVALQDFLGRKLLLYFYPKANTPGCTRQACSIRDAREELAAAGVVPLGISPDPPGVQKKFAAHHALDFPLLSDPEHLAARAYGAWGEKTLYGKKTQGIIRSAFLIDEKGRIIGAWYKVKPEDTVPLALKALSHA